MTIVSNNENFVFLILKFKKIKFERKKLKKRCYCPQLIGGFYFIKKKKLNSKILRSI